MQRASDQNIHTSIQKTVDVVRVSDTAGGHKIAIRADIPNPAQKVEIWAFHRTYLMQAHGDDSGRPGLGSRPNSGTAPQSIQVKIQRQDRSVALVIPAIDEFCSNNRAKIGGKLIAWIWRGPGIHPEFQSRVADA